MDSTKKTEVAEERIVSEAMTLPEAKRRSIAVALLKSVREWPDPHGVEFQDYIETAPAEEKEAALAAAIDEGLEDLAAGKGVKGTPSELMTRIDERLGMTRNDAS